MLKQTNSAGTESEHVLPTNLVALIKSARQRAPWLWWGAIASLLVSLPTVVMMLIDPTELNGVNIWLKPWKFQVSVAVHLATLAVCAVCLAPTIRSSRRLRIIGIVAVTCTVFELAYIAFQAARGRASHFNESTPFEGVMYGLMGVGAVSLTVCAGILGWWILRDGHDNLRRLLRVGIGSGLIIGCVLGTITGAYMAGQSGHWVGGTLSDANTWPIVHWSVDGGDLRVAHFFGLHALQLLPLAAWLMHRLFAPARNADNGLIAVWSVVTMLYTAWTAFTFWQAVQGQPLI